jgi:hypothetical protein
MTEKNRSTWKTPANLVHCGEMLPTNRLSHGTASFKVRKGVTKATDITKGNCLWYGSSRVNPLRQITRTTCLADCTDGEEKQSLLRNRSWYLYYADEKKLPVMNSEGRLVLWYTLIMNPHILGNSSLVTTRVKNVASKSLGLQAQQQ